MNNLTMGPLPAKIKSEVDIAGEKTVFRCGVRDCPEILAVIRPDMLQGRLHLYKPYFPNARGIYCVTRRSAQRSQGERQHKTETRWEYKKLKARSQARFCADPSPENIKSLDAVERMATRYGTLKRSFEGLQVPPTEAFPIVVRCARCGRDSKIQGAVSTA